MQDLRLIDYPEQLANLARQLHAADKLIRQKQHEVDRLIALFEHTIAFDTGLKNEAQRKAKRLELMDSDAYQEAHAALQQAQDDRHDLQIDYRLMADRFSAAKLTTREHIASLELTA